MGKTFEVLLLGGPPLLLAVVVSHLILRRGRLIERRDLRATLAQVLVFGSITALGRVGWSDHPVYVDTALFVVVVAGLQGGFLVGGGTGVIGALARLRLPVAARFAWITLAAGILAGLVGGRSDRPPRAAMAFVYGAASGVLQVICTCLTLGMSPLHREALLAYLPFLVMTGAWVALLELILDGLRGEIERHRLQRLAAEARLALLQSQIRPHFLFNALNTISAASRKDPEETRRLLQCLAEFLRSSLQATQPLIPVEEEVAALAPYIEIERARFGERLHLAQKVTVEARTARIPPLSLQPLVENAIRHGFREDGRPLTVLIEGERSGDRVVLRVTDDGGGMEKGAEAGDGMGLPNVRERITTRFGAEAFAVRSEPGTGTTVEIRLPAEGRP